RAMFDRRTGLVAAALGAVAPILVWYSQEARMYAQLALLGLIAIWALYRALESTKARYWAIYALAAAAMVWTQYSGLLSLVAPHAPSLRRAHRPDRPVDGARPLPALPVRHAVRPRRRPIHASARRPSHHVMASATDRALGARRAGDADHARRPGRPAGQRRQP